MAKSSKDRDRRAVYEEMRKKQAAKERRATLIFAGVAVIVAALILVIPVKSYLEDRRRENRDLSDIGVPAAAAACQPIKKKDAEGSGQHIEPGTPINYPDSPPAFGKHWGNYLSGSEIKNQYAVADRPPLERLVHSLEHGYTLLWYDETIGKDTAAMDDLDSIAERFPVGDKFMVVPWTKDDGDAFPDSAHIALTHWTGPNNQEGIWEYCGKVSGPVVQKFTEDYESDNAPEPNGG